MFKFYKDSAKYFKKNAKAIILFGLLYSLFSSSLVSVISKASMSLAMMACGIKFIGDNTIFTFFTSPFTWLILFLNALVLTFLTLIFSCATIYCVELSKNDIKANFNDLLLFGIKNAKRVFKKENFGIIIYALILTPFVSTIEISSAGLSVGIPGFILDAVFANRLYTIALLIVLTILVILVINWLLVLPIFTIEESDYVAAKEKSKQLMKGNRLKCIFLFVVANAIIFLVTILSVSVFYYSFNLLYTLTNLRIFNIVKVLSVAAIVIIGLLNSKFIYTELGSCLYFYILEEKNLEYKYVEKHVEDNKLLRFGFVVVGIVCLISSYTWSDYANVGYKVDFLPEIAAHRGDSVRAPENSMPAFKLALDENIATWVELDVHQTKDGVIIVSHDDDLSRIGIDKEVHDTTYEELIKYDSGKWFSKEYEGIHLCTLKEALEEMKNKVAVQIEIKPTEYDDHIEESVMSIIKEVNSLCPNVILSMSDSTIKRVKEIDPTFPTIYCTILASEGIENMEYADFFSIEESCISESLVRSIHAKGKSCFVWTINKKDNVQNLIDTGVDVILTDDPIMMKEAIRECTFDEVIDNNYEDFYYKIIEYINSLF